MKLFGVPVLVGVGIIGSCPSVATQASAAPPAATRPALGIRGLESVLIEGVPHVLQKPDFCGEACTAMMLGKLGHKGDQDWVFNQSGMDPLLGSGLRTGELAKALSAIGFKAGDVWYRADAGVTEPLQKHFADLHADLVRGVPSIVCMHYDDKPDNPGATEHFRLIVGFDADKDQVIYHEPAVKDAPYQRMAREKFLALWPLKYDPKKWTVIRLRLEAAKLKEFVPPAPAPGFTGFTPADYCQHVMELKKKLPKEGFSLALAPPFVVMGDGGAEAVRRYSTATVGWAVKQLKSTYFPKDPADIVDVWLFKDKDSYDQHTKSIFGDTPTTPFGYYSPAHKALIMNIATGGGTLVHEIVHPFMRVNFPACPAWFNEGMGSLYEQCGDREGKIAGYPNWRLRGLQEALKGGKVPTFEALTGTDDDEFYAGDGRATNYAQARYLCYYLQEKGLLVKYYQQFTAGVKDGPTGYKTLQKVLGEDDMAAFQKRWEEWVGKLKFP